MWTGPGRELAVRRSVAAMKMADLTSLAPGRFAGVRENAHHLFLRKYSKEFK